MKQLLMKEYKLSSCPLTFVFLAFSLMTMIPGYPILVGAFFICLGVLYTFQFAREDNDILYTALLPVSKSNVVKARFSFVISIQVIGYLFSLILTIVRMSTLSEAKVYVSNPLMNANFVYLGGYLFIMALFNIIFVTGFFKTACYFGKPFFIFAMVAFLFVGIMETLHHIPSLEMLNVCGWEHMGVQLTAFLSGMIIYIAVTWWSIKKSIAEFELIDL